MKRKQLERIEPEQMPEGLTGEFVMAAVLREIDECSILELDIWGKENAFGVRPMICRHFLNKHTKEYDTVFMSTQEFKRKTYHAGDWTKLGIGSILSRGSYYYSYYNDEKMVGLAKTQRIIKEYTKREEWRSAISSVDAIEREIRNERTEKTYQRRIDRVSDAMNKIEPVVDDEFREWLDEVVFPEKYIFAETRKLKTGYRMKCCACGKTFMIKEKPKHNEEAVCRKCGVKAVVKTRVQYVGKEKKVLVVQKYSEDTWVLRHFRFKKTYGTVCEVTKEYLEELEKVRMLLSAENATKIYYGQNNQYGADEWDQDWWDTKSGTGMMIDRDFFLYPKGITEAPIKIELKRMLLAGAVQGAELDYNSLVRYFEEYPYMEYLIKGRYYKLANEFLKDRWVCKDEFLDVNADNITDLLRLEPQRAYRLRDMDGGRCALELLQIEERDGIKISQENLEFADKNRLNENRLLIHRTQMGINKALNYIRRQMKRNSMSLSTVLQYYEDYLDMAEERGADITDDIIRANARMVEFHMVYLEEKYREEDETRTKQMEDKYPNIRKDCERNKMLFGWENEQYVLLVPRDTKDIIDEGRSQHHCVAASETYFNKMNQRESFILFLRKKEQEQIPWYTLEVILCRGEIKVVQKYAAYNRQPDIEIVNKILKQWKNEVEQRIKEEMRKAG